jgi:hypothetical protein
MARITNKEVLAARQDGAAPFLFDEDELPLKPEWVQAVREKRYEHTGARLLDDEVKCQQMVNLLCLGQGVKRVARAMKVSPHCVRAARIALVEQGKLAPFKERFVKRAEEFVEDGLTAMHEAVLNGRLHPNFMSSAVGTIFDKRALALGEPTTISVGATAALKPEALSVKALNAWADALPIEAESTGRPPESKENGGMNSVDAGFDASAGRTKATAAEVLEQAGGGMGR